MARKLDKADVAALTIAALFIGGWLTFVLGIGYIVIHFIVKFW